MERRGYQYSVMGLRREFRYGVTTADEGLRPYLTIKTQTSSSSVWSTVSNKPGNSLLSCHVYLINMRSQQSTTIRARHVSMDLARASYGTSAVAEYYALSAGIKPRPHTLLCVRTSPRYENEAVIPVRPRPGIWG